MVRCQVGARPKAIIVIVVLGTLLHKKKWRGNISKMLLRQAGRIATNRTVAGVHFPADSIAGATLGIALGRYLVGRATGSVSCKELVFDGRGIGRENFDPTLYEAGNIENPMNIDPAAMPNVTEGGNVSFGSHPKSKPFEWLWKLALKEWD
jgi:hypothetical protein